MENKYENKTTAREYSFKFLYFLLFEGDKTYLESLENDESSLDELINVFNESYIESDKEHPDNVLNSEILFFAKQVLGHTTTHLEEIKSIILPHISEKSQKNNKIEFAILMLAIGEHQSFPDTPRKVIMNETINIGKKFGTKESSSFINAVLDKVMSDTNELS